MAKQQIDAPARIKQLFEAVPISRVVYVDDLFCSSTEQVKDLCRDLDLVEIRDSGAFPDLDFTIDNEDVLRKRIEDQIEAMDADVIKKTFALLAEAKHKEPVARDEEAADAFADALGETTELITLSLREWKQRRADFVQSGQVQNTLFVFDEDFSLEGGSSTEGRKLAEALRIEIGDLPCLYAILTHRVQDEENEDGLQREIWAEIPNLRDNLTVIAKTRLSDDLSNFVLRLKQTVLSRAFSGLKEKLGKAVKSAQQQAHKRIQDELDIDAFEHIVLNSSATEGAWAPDTLVRIFSIIQEDGTVLRLRGDEEVHNLAEESRRVCGVQPKPALHQTKKKAFELQRAEAYDSGERINQLHLPIDLGDVFEIESSNVRRQFVLLAQPCDLMTREDGWRKDRERDSWQMLPLAPIRKGRLKRRRSSHRPECFEVLHFDPRNEHRYSAKWAHMLPVPAWILDLAVLNKDGQCQIGTDDEISALIIPTWRKRSLFLQELASDVVGKYNLIVDEAGERPEFLHALLRLPLSFSIDTAIEPSKGHGSAGLRVSMRRTGRMRQPFASAMLSHYAQFLARSAHPHDLTRLRQR